MTPETGFILYVMIFVTIAFVLGTILFWKELKGTDEFFLVPLFGLLVTGLLGYIWYILIQRIITGY